MIQLGECLSILLSSIKAITTGINKIQDLASNVSVHPFNEIVNVPKMFRKKLPQVELMGSKITLTNNKIKKSRENNQVFMRYINFIKRN